MRSSVIFHEWKWWTNYLNTLCLRSSASDSDLERNIRQAPLPVGFSRQEYWTGLLFPPPGGLPDPGIELESLRSPALAGGFFTTSTTWEAHWLGKGKRPKQEEDFRGSWCSVCLILWGALEHISDHTVPLRQENWIVTEISCYLSCWQQNTKNLGTEHRWRFWENLSKVPTMSNIATVTFIPGNSPAGFTAFAIFQVEFSNVHICLWTFFAYPTNPHLFLATSRHVFPSTICFNLHTALLPKDEGHFLLTNPCFSPDPGYFLPNLSFRPLTLWHLILLLLFTIFSRIIFTIQRWWVVLFSLW